MANPGIGAFTNVDAPKKALVSKEIIYMGSGFRSVMNRAGIPIIPVDTDKDIQYDVTNSTPGSYDVAVDAATDYAKIAYPQIKTTMKWMKRPYMILDGAKLSSRVPGTLASDSQKAVIGYFAACRDYVTINSMKTAAGGSAAATAEWGEDGSEIDTDIVNGLKAIDEDSNADEDAKYSVVLPSCVSFEAKKLTMIKNIQETMESYLGRSFNLSFFKYKPYKYKKTATADSATTVLDGLGNDAMIFVQGRETAMQLEFSSEAAAAKGVPLSEMSRIQDRGELYTTRMCVGCLPVWDSLAEYTSSTSYKTNRIYKITGVKS